VTLRDFYLFFFANFDHTTIYSQISIIHNIKALRLICLPQSQL